MTKEVIEDTYKRTSKALFSIYQKRKLATIFNKVIWLLTGLFFIAIVLNVLSSFYSNTFKITWFDQFKSTIDNPYASLYPYLVIFALMYISMFSFSFFFKKFKTLEAETISKMVKSLFPHFKFNQSSQLNVSQIKASNLFPWLKLNTVVVTYGEMKAEIKGVNMSISDIGVIEKNISNKLTEFISKIPILNLLVILYQFILKNIFTSKTADNVYFTFRGMYFRAIFNKKLQGSTVVVPNNMSSKINRYASFNFKEEEIVQLEDIRFTNNFTVYGSDQIESRYVLSTSLMEKIVDLKEKFNRDIMLSFLGNKIFLLVENPNGLFSFSSGKLDSIKIIEELAIEINTAQNIVEDFNLDRKTYVV